MTRITWFRSVTIALLLASGCGTRSPAPAPSPAVAAAAPLSPWRTPVFPGCSWETVPVAESAGYRSAALDSLRTYLHTLNTTGMIVAVHGRVLLSYGNVTEQSYLASARKSVLSMLYGIPFPFPTTALEIVHNYDRLTVMADNLNSMPMSIGLYGKEGRRERVEKIELHWQNYAGRIKLAPLPAVPGFADVLEKGSILALYPYDLKGYAAVRTRFKDPGAEDRSYPIFLHCAESGASPEATLRTHWWALI